MISPEKFAELSGRSISCKAVRFRKKYWAVLIFDAKKDKEHGEFCAFELPKAIDYTQAAAQTIVISDLFANPRRVLEHPGIQGVNFSEYYSPATPQETMELIMKVVPPDQTN